MAFNGKEGDFISLTEAADMTAAWRNGSNGTTKAVFFGKDKLDQVLEQEGCVGIRMYFAENSDGEKALVLVGADADKNDMDAGLILDRGAPCPADCPDPNPLNG